MAKVTGFDLVKQDLQKYANNYMRHLATILGEEMTKETGNIIELFYKDYTPTSYQRHYYNLRDNSYQRYYSNKHGGRTYVCGVRVTPELMDDLYNAPTEQVLSSVWDGFHGLPYDHTINPATQQPKHEPIGWGHFVTADGKLHHTGKDGLPALAAPRMKPTPLELLEAKRDELVEDIDKYSNQAHALAMKDKYKFIM